MEDLFPIVPPSEIVKALPVVSVQRRDRTKKIRKLMFIDVSKAHLYAPVDAGANACVDLPPECSKPGVCGKLQYWLYGMRPASHDWQGEYTRRLVGMGFVAGEASLAAFMGKQMMSRA